MLQPVFVWLPPWHSTAEGTEKTTMPDKPLILKNQTNWDSYSAAYLRFKHNEKIIQRIVDDPSRAFESETWRQLCSRFPDFRGKQI
jgi:hypothetical protein